MIVVINNFDRQQIPSFGETHKVIQMEKDFNLGYRKT
jgi:hypothetical protein